MTSSACCIISEYGPVGKTCIIIRAGGMHTVVKSLKPVASQTALSLDNFKKKRKYVLGNLSCVIGNLNIWKVS